MNDAERRKAQRAWCLYDWGNSAFATSVTTAILPPWFAGLAARTLTPAQATAYWGYANSALLAVCAVLSPLVGAWADRRGGLKRILFVSVLIGALGSIGMAFTPPGHWRFALACFAPAFVAFTIAIVLYNTLLPVVARPAELDRVSARGYGLGYLGGGLLLALHLAWILKPQWFALPSAEVAIRLAFATAGLWWLGFSLPLFRDVPEPRRHGKRTTLGDLPAETIRGLRGTFRHVIARPDLLRYIAAFWLFSDGIGTVMRMASVYGAEVGIGRESLIGALLMVQLVAAPASVAFGRMAPRFGPQRVVIVGLVAYAGIALFAFFLSEPWQFWTLAGFVALVQGGTQALSRSMFASLVPRRRMGEMFGFYSVSERLAGVVGPLVFGFATELGDSGRFGALTLIPFFLIGAWLLGRVDLERGRAQAAEDDGDPDAATAPA